MFLSSKQLPGFLSIKQLAGVLAFLIGLTALMAAPLADGSRGGLDGGSTVSSALSNSLDQSTALDTQLAACCKTCRKGKACGNSCIKRSYTCTKPPGCACDGLRPETPGEQLLRRRPLE